MSSRPILSRPRRTKVYDCNYDMGERYYRPVVDSLDRKYTGGRISTPPIDGDLLFPSTASIGSGRRSLLRDEEPEDILPRPRRPASALLNEYDSIFDSRGKVLGGRGLPSARQIEDEAEQEFGASLKRIKDSRAASRSAFRDEIESTTRGADTFSDKLLDSMGLKTSSVDDDSFFKKRTLKVTSTLEDELDAPSMTKWSAIKSGARRDFDVDLSGAAQARARKSRARIADIDAEMEDMAQKTAAREQRSANLRALMAEAEAVGSEQDAAVSSVRVRAVKTEKKVTF